MEISLKRDLFRNAKDPDISIPDLLTRPLVLEDIQVLESLSLSTWLQETTHEHGGKPPTKALSIDFSFSHPSSDQKSRDPVKGRISIGHGKYNNDSRITSMEITTASSMAPEQIGYTWRYRLDPDNPMYGRDSSVSLDLSLSSLNRDLLAGYRRIKLLDGIPLIFDSEDQLVEDATKGQTITAAEASIVTSTYVLQRLARESQFSFSHFFR